MVNSFLTFYENLSFLQQMHEKQCPEFSTPTLAVACSPYADVFKAQNLPHLIILFSFPREELRCYF